MRSIDQTELQRSHVTRVSKATDHWARSIYGRKVATGAPPTTLTGLTPERSWRWRESKEQWRTLWRRRSRRNCAFTSCYRVLSCLRDDRLWSEICFIGASRVILRRESRVAASRGVVSIDVDATCTDSTFGGGETWDSSSRSSSSGPRRVTVGGASRPAREGCR